MWQFTNKTWPFCLHKYSCNSILMPVFAVHLPQYSPLDLPLIVGNIHHCISTILATLLTTSFTITFIAIFLTICHYHLKRHRLCFYHCNHSTFYMFNMNIYTLYSNPTLSNDQRKNYPYIITP